MFGRFLEAGRKQLILCYIICTVPVATPLPGAGSGYHCTNHQQLKSSNRQQPTTTHNDQPNNDATATIATTHTQHPKPRLPLGRGGLRPFPNPCTTCPSSFFSKPIVILRYVLSLSFWLISVHCSSSQLFLSWTGQSCMHDVRASWQKRPQRRRRKLSHIVCRRR